MARRASRHRHRRAVAASRRIVTVAVSAAATVALGIGYVAGDLTDVVPGVLTLQPMRIPTVPSARTARAADPVLADADRSIPVDAAAADALIDTFLGSEGVGSDVSIAIAGRRRHRGGGTQRRHRPRTRLDDENVNRIGGGHRAGPVGHAGYRDLPDPAGGADAHAGA